MTVLVTCRNFLKAAATAIWAVSNWVCQQIGPLLVRILREFRQSKTMRSLRVPSSSHASINHLTKCVDQ